MAERNLILRPTERRGEAPVISDLTPNIGRREGTGTPPELPSVPSPPLGGTWTAAAGPAVISGVPLQVHGNLAEVEHEWRAFESRADRTVFQSFDWLAKWQRHIGARRNTRPAIVLGRDDEGHLLFILQLAIERRAGVRCLTWLGSGPFAHTPPPPSGH